MIFQNYYHYIFYIILSMIDGTKYWLHFKSLHCQKNTWFSHTTLLKDLFYWDPNLACFSIFSDQRVVILWLPHLLFYCFSFILDNRHCACLIKWTHCVRKHARQKLDTKGSREQLTRNMSLATVAQFCWGNVLCLIQQGLHRKHIQRFIMHGRWGYKITKHNDFPKPMNLFSHCHGDVVNVWAQTFLPQ